MFFKVHLCAMYLNSWGLKLTQAKNVHKLSNLVCSKLDQFKASWVSYIVESEIHLFTQFYLTLILTFYSSFKWRHDTQNNDTQDNVKEHKDTQHNAISIIIHKTRHLHNDSQQKDRALLCLMSPMLSS